jgi:YVTN family beta-propeller protein
VENREITRIAGLHEPHNMTFSPDGTQLFVGNLGANFVSVIDVAQGKVVAELGVGKDRALASLSSEDEHQGIINVTRTPDGRLGFAAFGDGDDMAVFDLRTREKVGQMQMGDTPWRAYATADGRFMIVPNNGDETVSVFSTQAPFEEVARLKGAADMTGVNTGWFETTAFVISRGDDKLVILDLVEMKNAGEIDLTGGSPETAVTTPDGTKLYVALSGSNEVAVIDVKTRKLIKKIGDVGKEPWGAHMVGAINYCH